MLSFLLLSVLGWNTTCAVDFTDNHCDCFFHERLGPYYDGYRRPPEFYSFEPAIDQTRLDEAIAGDRWEVV